MEALAILKDKYGIEKKLRTNVPIQSTVTLKFNNKKQKNY